MRDIAVHDIANPGLDLGGNLTGLTLGAHGDVDVLATVVDLRDGADEVGSASGKGLEDAALGIGFDELVNSVLALRDLNLASKALASQLNSRAAGDAIEDQLVIERSGDELLLSVLALPENEEVGGTGLGAFTVGAIQPKNLVVTATTSISGGQQRGAVVGTDLGVAEAANPGADHVLWGGVQAHTTGGAVHAGHVGDDDVEHGLLGGLDAELGLSADEGRAEVEEVAGLVARQPAGTVDLEKSHDQLLKLGRGKGRQGDAAGGHVHAGAVAVGAEDAQAAVVAAEDLEALEALGSIVQAGCSGHEAEGSVGLQLGGGPALGGRPVGENHVVGGNGLSASVGDGLIRDLAWVLGVGVGDLGGVELGEVGSLLSGNLLALNGRGREVDVLILDGGGRHCWFAMSDAVESYRVAPIERIEGRGQRRKKEGMEGRKRSERKMKRRGSVFRL